MKKILAIAAIDYVPYDVSSNKRGFSFDLKTDPALLALEHNTEVGRNSVPILSRLCTVIS